MLSANDRSRGTRSVAAVALGLAAFACSARVPLQHTQPAARLTAEGTVIGCRSTEDRRTDKEIDEVLDGASLAAVDRALQAEVAGSGVAQQVVVLPGASRGSDLDAQQKGAAVVVEPVLEEMVWEVPDYKQKVATTFVVSLLTGGIGGLTYGSTSTDVYGRTKLTVTFIDVATGRKLTKTYEVKSQEQMAKLFSDEAETKSKLVGASLTSAMQQFRTDLVTFVDPRSAPGAGAPAAVAGQEQR